MTPRQFREAVERRLLVERETTLVDVRREVPVQYAATFEQREADRAEQRAARREADDARNATIHALKASGLTAWAIAARVGCSHVTVRKVLKEARNGMGATVGNRSEAVVGVSAVHAGSEGASE